MKSIFVYAELQRKALVTRDSARELETRLRGVLGSGGDSRITVDFERVDAVTPSFIDELLLVIEAIVTDSGTELVFSHPPTRLSAKFAAIARAHAATLEERPDGSWLWGLGVGPAVASAS